MKLSRFYLTRQFHCVKIFTLNFFLKNFHQLNLTNIIQFFQGFSMNLLLAFGQNWVNGTNCAANSVPLIAYNGIKKNKRYILVQKLSLEPRFYYFDAVELAYYLASGISGSRNVRTWTKNCFLGSPRNPLKTLFIWARISNKNSFKKSTRFYEKASFLLI